MEIHIKLQQQNEMKRKKILTYVWINVYVIWNVCLVIWMDEEALVLQNHSMFCFSFCAALETK